MPAISLAPEVVFKIGGLAITNTMLATMIISLVMIILALLIRRNAGVIPTKLQTGFELLMNFMVEKMELTFGTKEKARRYIPLIITIFIMLLIVNQFSLIPLVESFIVNGEAALLRTPTSDYSLPIALAIMVLTISHVIALKKAPLKHIGNFIKIKAFTQMKSIKDLPMALLEFFLGLLDIVGEFAKLISISTRLFGNMFAGGVVVIIISGLTVLTQYIVPMPFIILGILSGVVQAFVFAMLSVLYISSTLNAVEN